MRAERELVTHCTGQDEECGWEAGEGGDVLFEGIGG